MHTHNSVYKKSQWRTYKKNDVPYMKFWACFNIFVNTFQPDLYIHVWSTRTGPCSLLQNIKVYDCTQNWSSQRQVKPLYSIYLGYRSFHIHFVLTVLWRVTNVQNISLFYDEIFFNRIFAPTNSYFCSTVSVINFFVCLSEMSYRTSLHFVLHQYFLTGCQLHLHNPLLSPVSKSFCKVLWILIFRNRLSDFLDIW